MIEQLPNDQLFNWRKKAWDRFEEIGLPRPKQEAFQYLNFQKFSPPLPAERKSLPSAPQAHLVFVDGYFDEKFSQIPASLICQPLDKAMRSYGIFLQNRLTRTLKEETDPFAALNGAFQGNGIFLYVPPKCKLDIPLQILSIYTSEEMASPRLQLYLGREASLNIVQTSLHTTEQTFSNLVVDAVLDENAELSLLDEQKLPPLARHFQACRATLKRNSRFKMLSHTKGSSLARSSIRVQLTEENAETELKGLARLNGSNQSHAHVLVEHLAPHTRSRQHFKNVLNGKSRSSFEGKIFVAPIAQKTEAYQLNNNLLLSDEATANAKPNLEIFADDVKASHGATISQLNEEELFYLRSRGLSLNQARECLVEGFCRL